MGEIANPMTSYPSNAIPRCIDPRGRIWLQPNDIRWAPMDDESVILTPYQVSHLVDLVTSQPRTVFEGKVWRGECDGCLTLFWYYTNPENPKQCLVQKRKILIVEEDKPND